MQSTTWLLRQHVHQRLLRMNPETRLRARRTDEAGELLAVSIAWFAFHGCAKRTELIAVVAVADFTAISSRTLWCNSHALRALCDARAGHPTEWGASTI